jgi:hypothetical protein
MRDEAAHEWGTQIGNLWVGHPSMKPPDNGAPDWFRPDVGHSVREAIIVLKKS